MRKSKKDILLFLFGSWIFLQGVLQYIDFVDIISKNKDIIKISQVYWRFFNALKYFIFEVGHVEIIEDRTRDKTHRYHICLNVNITKVIMKWNFSSGC